MFVKLWLIWRFSGTKMFQNKPSFAHVKAHCNDWEKTSLPYSFSLMSPASTHRHHRKWMPWSGHPSSCHPKEVRLSPWSESWVAKGGKMWLRRAIWSNHLRFSGQFMRFLSQFMVPRHGHFTWRLMIMGFWGVSRPSHWKCRQVAGLVNQISKRVEWGGCKFWISKRKSSPRLNLNQPWIVSAILSYIIYYICILGCSVL